MSSIYQRISSACSSAYSSLPGCPSISTPEFAQQGCTYVKDYATWSYDAVKSRVPDWFPFGGYLSAMATSCGSRIDSAVKWLGFKDGISGISKLWPKAVV